MGKKESKCILYPGGTIKCPDSCPWQNMSDEEKMKEFNTLYPELGDMTGISKRRFHQKVNQLRRMIDSSMRDGGCVMG